MQRNKMNQHYITVISENVITRALIVEYLTQNQGYKVTSCDSIALFLESLRLESHIDIILLEVTTHGQNALKHFYKLGKLVPNAKVLVFFEHLDKDLLIEAIKDGAAGYYALNTNFKLLSLAIENLMNNNRVLSPEAVIFLIEALKENPTPPPPQDHIFSAYNLNEREISIMNGLIGNFRYKEIAKHNFISINTVRHYVLTLYRKTGVNNRQNLIKKMETYRITNS